MLEAGSSPFLFALGITNLDISPNATVRYFDFSLTQKAVLKIDGTNIPTTIQLVACNRSDWAALGQDFATYYDTIGFSTWLCPK